MKKGTVKQTSWNFIQGKGVLPTDPELFFGPLDGEEIHTALDMVDILVLTGVFPSKSRARKEGWGEDCEPTFQWKERGAFCVVERPGRRVPKGFTLFRIGKGKATEIAILRVD